MKNVKQKRGRPATGRTPIIALRLSADETQTIDDLAAEWGIDRSKALRMLLREGLAACIRKKRRAEAAHRRATAATAAMVAVAEVACRTELQRARARAQPSLKRWPRYRQLTPEEIKAAADRAEQRRG